MTIEQSTWDRTTTPVTVPLRNSFPAKTFAGKTVYIPFAELKPELIVELLEAGALRILNDGNGKADMTDDERYAKMQKRVDAWRNGSFRIVERADNITSLMKECYIAEQLAKHEGSTQKQVEAAMKDTVKATLGDVNATFDNFAKAVATTLAKRKGESRSVTELHEALLGKYEAKARELEAERSKASAKVSIDLDDFDL